MIKYSYFCLQEKPNLCAGVSIPSTSGFAVNGTYLQLKGYLRNINKGLDNKKMRWSLESNGHLVLQDRFPFSDSLCADVNFDYFHNISDVNAPLYLRLCSEVRTQWRFDSNRLVYDLVHESSTTSSYCLTATNCDHGKNNVFCHMTRLFATSMSQIIGGSYLTVAPCFSPTTPGFVPSQALMQDLNCTQDCSPEMLSNQVCDTYCDNPICENDYGYCVSKSPTLAMTLSPTTPTLRTTFQPMNTFSPTGMPSLKTNSPSPPTMLEVPVAEENYFGYMWLLVFVILTCLLWLFCVNRRRQRQRRRVNDALIEEEDDVSGIRILEEPRFQTVIPKRGGKPSSTQELGLS